MKLLLLVLSLALTSCATKHTLIEKHSAMRGPLEVQNEMLSRASAICKKPQAVEMHSDDAETVANFSCGD